MSFDFIALLFRSGRSKVFRRVVAVYGGYTFHIGRFVAFSCN